MDYFKSLLGGNPAQAPAAADDSDFVDFAAAPSPKPVAIPSSPGDALGAVPTEAPHSPVLYTKWYRVWERTSPSDFYMEAVLIPLIVLALIVHFWGTATNKKKAKKWMAVHAPLLETEFAVVGYHGQPNNTPYPQGVTDASILETSLKSSSDSLSDDYLKESTAYEYQSYATGRLNVAFMDIKLVMKKRYNPIILAGEHIFALLFESVNPPNEHMEASMYTFDGMEKDFVPPSTSKSTATEKPKSAGNSSYDPFVFAIVNKMSMRRLRDERYDVSLTSTKDSPKLPQWATVMSESAEITETILTKELIAAIEKAGDALEYLIISDQPDEKPIKLLEAVPKKRLIISMKLDAPFRETVPLFQAFLRLPDYLVSNAHFRPEVMRKITQTREAELKKLKKVGEAEAEEDRKLQMEKLKKEERERKMRGMNAEEQKKFLEKERERDRKRGEKKMARKG